MIGAPWYTPYWAPTTNRTSAAAIHRSANPFTQLNRKQQRPNFRIYEIFTFCYL